MNSIHINVEQKRGYQIPNGAYQEVLNMLIDYSIHSYELLERNLSTEEKKEVFRVFSQLGKQMNLKALPQTFEEWLSIRQYHLEEGLHKSDYTNKLYKQYRKRLGLLRFYLLKETQSLLVPKEVSELLAVKENSYLKHFIKPYKKIKALNVDWIVKRLLIPNNYLSNLRDIDNHIRQIGTIAKSVD